MSSGITCKHDNCGEERANLSVFCERHHTESLKAVQKKITPPPIPSNPKVEDALTDPDLAEALEIALTRGIDRGSNEVNDNLDRRFGSPRAAELRSLIAIVRDDYFSCRLELLVPGADENDVAQNEFLSRYPQTDAQVIRVLRNYYAYCRR